MVSRFTDNRDVGLGNPSVGCCMILGVVVLTVMLTITMKLENNNLMNITYVKATKCFPSKHTTQAPTLPHYFPSCPSSSPFPLTPYFDYAAAGCVMATCYHHHFYCFHWCDPDQAICCGPFVMGICSCVKMCAADPHHQGSVC